MPLTRARVAALPKVVLHDHLDGGLRPSTVIDLSREVGIDPPGTDAAQVADWFHDAADSGSLPAYLSTFERTVALTALANGFAPAPLREALAEEVVRPVHAAARCGT